MKEAKTVFFYSFKGGVGRTQLLLNVAKFLTTDKNKKIAIVDFDLYAPGLSYLAKFNGNNKNYLINFLLDMFQDKQTELYYENINDNLVLIPAINPRNIFNYHNLLNQLSQYTYSIKKGAEDREDNSSTIADQIAEYIKRYISRIMDFDYIFFDGRTGITEVSDILFSKEIDLKVMISSYNQQNINGITSILDMMSKYKGSKEHLVLRVFSPKPVGEHERYKEIEEKGNIVDKTNIKIINSCTIPYEEVIVHNDFDVWEELDNNNRYKLDVITIANEIMDVFSDVSDSKIMNIYNNNQQKKSIHKVLSE